VVELRAVENLRKFPKFKVTLKDEFIPSAKGPIVPSITLPSEHDVSDLSY